MKKGDQWEKGTCDWLDHTVWGERKIKVTHIC